jgi:hypothetical protein
VPRSIKPIFSHVPDTVLPLEEARLALPGSPKLLGMERMRETAPTVVVGRIIAGGQEAKTEIRADIVSTETITEGAQ